MKIILLKDIAKVGKRYDVKDVNSGHALNFLIPKGLAVSATKEAIKRIDLEKARKAGEIKVQNELLESNIQAL